jgi:hypothetical protein
MEQWWNDTDRGKLKHWERNLSQRNFVYQKILIDRSGIEPVLSPCGFDDYQPEP